jgi:hypothetical protein
LKPLIIDVAELARYPLLRRIVLSLKESAHQTRPRSSASGRTFRDPLLRTFHGRDSFCVRVTKSATRLDELANPNHQLMDSRVAACKIKKSFFQIEANCLNRQAVLNVWMREFLVSPTATRHPRLRVGSLRGRPVVCKPFTLQTLRSAGLVYFVALSLISSRSFANVAVDGGVAAACCG